MTTNCHHASARSAARTGSAPTRWMSTASRITPARRSSRLRNLLVEAVAVDRTIVPLGTLMRCLARAPLLFCLGVLSTGCYASVASRVPTVPIGTNQDVKSCEQDAASASGPEKRS